MGVTTAPVVGSGAWPAWMARVSKAGSSFAGTAFLGKRRDGGMRRCRRGPRLELAGDGDARERGAKERAARVVEEVHHRVRIESLIDGAKERPARELEQFD